MKTKTEVPAFRSAECFKFFKDKEHIFDFESPEPSTLSVCTFNKHLLNELWVKISEDKTNING